MGKREVAEFRNLSYKSDAEYVIRVARMLMTPIGIWPLYRGDSSLDKFKTFLHAGAVFCLMCFMLIPHLIYTFFDAENLKRYMKVIAAMIFSLLGIIKFFTVIVNKKVIRYCLLEMERQYQTVRCEEDRLIMIRSAKVGRLLTLTYLGLTYGGALPYHVILPLVAERIIKEDNTTMIPLPYQSDYVFFVVESSPLYEIVFVTQIFISTIILSTNTGIYSMIACCVMHSCCLFEVISRQIETILENERDDDDLSERLGGIINQHLEAIKFSEMIEKALNIVFLCEMVGCTIIVCFLEYGVLQDWEDGKHLGMITYFVLMSSIFVNVFIISYIGDRLKTESARVGEATYCIRWYGLPKNIVRDLIIIIIPSSRPTTLTAGKIFDLSLQGFCEVCKTSAAYLNFLRAMVA